MLYKTIFNSDDFIIINKLVSCSFHSDEGGGLFESVKLDHPSIISVHRLDKPTTGLCIFAKNSEAAKIFGEMFSKKLIEKIYLALSDKKPNKKQGLIIGDMEKARGGSYRLTKFKTNPAITQFKSFLYKPGKRLFVLKPITGKTHQLRVMMKSIGSPIIGDARYKGTPSETLYLQAHQLKFSFNSVEYCFCLENFLDVKIDKIKDFSIESISWPVLKKNG